MKFLFHFFESKNYILLERRAQFDSLGEVYFMLFHDLFEKADPRLVL